MSQNNNIVKTIFKLIFFEMSIINVSLWTLNNVQWGSIQGFKRNAYDSEFLGQTWFPRNEERKKARWQL